MMKKTTERGWFRRVGVPFAILVTLIANLIGSIAFCTVIYAQSAGLTKPLYFDLLANNSPFEIHGVIFTPNIDLKVFSNATVTVENIGATEKVAVIAVTFWDASRVKIAYGAYSLSIPAGSVKEQTIPLTWSPGKTTNDIATGTVMVTVG